MATPSKKPEKTEKAQPVDSAKRKTAPLRKPRAEAQAFDVIPPAKVMPTSTSRPVITAVAPEQTDNTLTAGSPASPSTAPLVHRELVLNPLDGSATPGSSTRVVKEPDAESADGVAVPQTAPDVPQDAASGAPPSAAGPTVAQLLSKQKKTVTPDDDVPAVLAPRTRASVAASAAAPSPGPEAKDAAAEPAAAPEVSETPKDQVAKPADEPAAKEGPKPARGPNPEARPVTRPVPEASAEDGAAAAAEPSDNTADLSQGLKDSLAGRTGDKSQEPAPEPDKEPELYGGKPVILVDEPHPFQEALKAIVITILLLALVALVVDLLLDAGIISLGVGLPHSNFF